MGNINKQSFDIDEAEELSDTNEKAKASNADLCWYDSLVEKQNIAKNDQEDKQEGNNKQSPFLSSVKHNDRIKINKDILTRETSLERLKAKLEERNQGNSAIGQHSVLNQVLRQCNHMRQPLATRNIQPLIVKTRAIEELKTEIRRYQNESQLDKNARDISNRSRSPSMQQSFDAYLSKPGSGLNTQLRTNLNTSGTAVTQDVVKPPF